MSFGHRAQMSINAPLLRFRCSVSCCESNQHVSTAADRFQNCILQNKGISWIVHQKEAALGPPSPAREDWV